MARLYPVALLLLLSLITAGCGTAPSQPAQAELVVSAAASLRDALEELSAQYQAEYGDVTLRFNYGSSGALRQQIEQGAPVDLFISAAASPMEALADRGLVSRADVVTLAANRVVLIRPADVAVVTDWATVAEPAVVRFAIGNPLHVPAGQYGRAVLEHLGYWERLQGRLVLGEDVRQVLAYVESGEVQAGLVYRTDAATSGRVTVVAEAPPGSHAPILYPMAVVAGTKHRDQATRFAQYLLSDQARQILERYGFEVSR